MTMIILRSRVKAIAAYRHSHPAWAVPALVLIAALLVTGGTRAQNLADQDNASQSVEAKLKTIVIPKVQFKDTALKDVLNFLRQKSVELDRAEKDPAKRGVNLVLRPGGKPDVIDTPITLNLTNVPLGDAFRYTADLGGLDYRVNGPSVVIQPKSDKPVVEENAPEKPAGKVGPIEAKLKQIVIPNIKMRDMPFNQAIEFLRQSSITLDSEKNPAKQGVNFIIRGKPRKIGEPAAEMPKVTMQLTSVSLGDALRYITQLSNYEVELTENAVVLEPKD